MEFVISLAEPCWKCFTYPMLYARSPGRFKSRMGTPASSRSFPGVSTRTRRAGGLLVGKPKCGCHCALPIIPAMRCRIPPGMHGRGSLLIHLGYKFRNITAKIYHTLDLLTKIVENGARQVLAVLQIILFCVVVLGDLYWSNR